MNKEEIKKAFFGLLEGQRGAASIQELIDVITLVALVAKKVPERFRDVEINGANYQLDAIRTLIKSIPEKDTGLYESMALERISSTALAQIVYFIGDIQKDLHELPHVVRWFLGESLRSIHDLGNAESVTQLFVELVGDARDKTLYDGAAGLAELASAINPAKMILEEINHQVWLIGFRLLILENRNPQFANCDSLISSKFPPAENEADIVAMQPPFGSRLQPHQTYMLDINSELLLVRDKKIPSSAGDVIWIQKAIRQLNAKGKAYLLLPIGWLFRGGYDAKVRDYLLDEDLIESIIALPHGLLPGSGIQTSLLIINKAKLKGSPIYFIDATAMGKKTRRGTELSNDEVKLISRLAAGQDISHRKCTAVQIPEIRSQGKNRTGNDLTPSRYFKADKVDLALPNLDLEFEKLKRFQNEFDQAQSQLLKLLSSN